MQINEQLVALVNSVLGTGKSTSRGNKSYICPKCHHHKPKLEINFDNSSHNYQNFACWACGFKGKKVYQVLKSFPLSPELIADLKSLTKGGFIEKQITVEKKVELPKEFKSLLNVTQTDITGRHALSYLKSRHITEEDIIKYNIGYCENGKYAKMIIIPSYDKNGILNYFTGRSFNKDSKQKYQNPDVSRDVIPFELFINWEIPFILCEGPFDAIAIKRNTIPLLGKNIQSNLMKQIVKSSVEKIYIALDKDAQKQALTFCERLMKEGKEVYLLDLNDKDPSEMGFNNFTKLIQDTYPLTFSNLLEKKLQL
jgi:DNA primase